MPSPWKGESYVTHPVCQGDWGCEKIRQSLLSQSFRWPRNPRPSLLLRSKKFPNPVHRNNRPRTSWRHSHLPVSRYLEYRSTYSRIPLTIFRGLNFTAVKGIRRLFSHLIVTVKNALTEIVFFLFNQYPIFFRMPPCLVLLLVSKLQFCKTVIMLFCRAMLSPIIRRAFPCCL